MSARRHYDVVALAFQTAREHVAIQFVIVDDEDPVDSKIHFVFFSRTKFSIFPCKRKKSTGLVSKSLQPTSNALARSVSRACAVRIMMGIWRVTASDLSFFVASHPFITGRLISIRMTSGD